MSQSLANVLLHVIFSTKNRDPFIDETIAPELYAYMATALDTFGCPAVKIGGASDHVHILCNLSRTKTIANLVETAKTDSSSWLKTKGPQFTRFYWQSGYGAFSVAQSQVESVKQYIENQREHHKRKTFQEEYRELLQKCAIKYNEKYVWD